MNILIGTKKSINITYMFNNSYHSKCQLTKYQISKVVSFGHSIESAVYNNLFALSPLGIFTTSNQASTAYQNYRIYIKAFNSEIWG